MQKERATVSEKTRIYERAIRKEKPISKERVVIKVKSHICTKCGMEIELPEFDETKPISEYFPKWERTVLKHAWEYHHEDFPPEIKSFNQFTKWLVTPEGKGWNRQQGKWRNKLLNGFVTQYCRKEDEPKTP